MQVFVRDNNVEIVLTQMTKARPLAVGTERDHVADFNLAIADHHPVNQEFDELAPAREVRISQTGQNPTAEVRG